MTIDSELDKRAERLGGEIFATLVMGDENDGVRAIALAQAMAIYLRSFRPTARVIAMEKIADLTNAILAAPDDEDA